jgi:alpha-tubulin suppressor-like RCC1 family protein
VRYLSNSPAPQAACVGLLPSKARRTAPRWPALLAFVSALCWTMPAGTPAASAAMTVIPAGATAVSAGKYQACALLAGGGVKCWGLGQLGNGSTSSKWSPEPVSVQGITDAVAVSAGGNHDCALLADGTVECWGNNSWGALGDGSGESSSVPVKVAGLSSAVDVASGDFHSCAALDDGTAWCWGEDVDGQLGDGAGGWTLAQLEPVQASGLGGVTALSAGLLHTCAAQSGGTLECWGGNNAGQLGLGSGVWEQTTPLPVPDVSDVVAVTAGGYHTCALLVGGDVDCWGNDTFGELGDGGGGRFAPVRVVGLHGATAVSAGFYHTCALLIGGDVDCWGENSHGQLGDGTQANRSTPVPAYGIQHATAVSAGYDYTCAVLAGGAVECWGGEYGNIEVPLVPSSPNPTPTPTPGAPTAPKQPPAAAPPKTQIISTPSKETADKRARFTFTGVAGGTYECSVDAGPWRRCRSGEDFGPLPPGDHRFRVRETLNGLTGPADSYSWTIDLPRACVLRVARARVFAFTHQHRVRLVIHYKTYRPARVTVSYKLHGARGSLALGSASSHFKTAGIFRLPERLNKRGVAKVRATRAMTVKFTISKTPTSCGRYYTKRLTIPKRIFGQTVWFQSDSIFTS